MSDKSQRRSSARISSVENSSNRQEGRLSARAAADETFFEMSLAKETVSKNEILTDDDFAIFGLDMDPTLQLG